jgi:TonB family protein
MKRILVLFLFIGIIYPMTYTAQIGYNVDILPSNVGGKLEFKRMFEQELVYPKKALDNKTDGKVTISFTLTKDSTAKNLKVFESVSPEIDAEALRIFKFYQWVPAMKGGQFVTTEWTASFDFVSSKYSRICKDRGFVNVKYLNDYKVDTTGKIYKTVEQFPMYPKGNFALQDFIKENLEYPKQAKLSNIQGTVLLRYIVEPSGLMTNIGIAKSIGGGCDQEAIRILEMIKWYPGRIEDKFVRTEMTFPFYFILNEDFKDNSAGEQK